MGEQPYTKSPVNKHDGTNRANGKHSNPCDLSNDTGGRFVGEKPCTKSPVNKHEGTNRANAWTTAEERVTRKQERSQLVDTSDNANILHSATNARKNRLMNEKQPAVYTNTHCDTAPTHEHNQDNSTPEDTTYANRNSHVCPTSRNHRCGRNDYMSYQNITDYISPGANHKIDEISELESVAGDNGPVSPQGDPRATSLSGNTTTPTALVEASPYPNWTRHAIIEHAGRNPSRTHNSYERTPIELQFIGQQRDEQSIIRRNPSHTNASSTTAEGHQRDEPPIIPLHQSHMNASSTTAERRQRDKQSIILRNRSPTNDTSTAADDNNDGSTRRPVRPEEGTPSHTRIFVTTSLLPLSLVYGHHHQANKAPSTNSMLDESPRRQLDAASTISRNTFSTTHLAQRNVDDPLKEKHGTHHAMISQSMSAAFHDSRSIPSKTAIIHTTSPRGPRPNQVSSETDPGFTDSATNRSMRKAPLRSNDASDMSTPNPTSETKKKCLKSSLTSA